MCDKMTFLSLHSTTLLELGNYLVMKLEAGYEAGLL